MININVGDKVIEKRIVTDEDVMHFAELSLDYNPIHFEDSKAREEGLPGRIVHGMLIGSFFSKIIGTEMPGDGTIYVSQSLNFLRPVISGEELTILVEVAQYLGEKRFRLTTNCYNESNQIVVQGEAEVLVKNYAE